jgi:dihydroorotate dehydrogenase
LAREPGGLSGEPLREISNQMIGQIRAVAGPDIVIVGVGGVMSLDDVLGKLAAGADLVGLYSGLVFEGPLLARRLALELDAVLARNGVATVAELVGRRAPWHQSSSGLVPPRRAGSLAT